MQPVATPELKPMAPVDEWSGLPLPLIPHPRNPYVAEINSFEPSNDWHHGNFPRRKLIQTLGGTAMRNVGVVYVPRPLHKQMHRKYRGGQHPQTPEAQAEAAVLAAAGYVPDQAVSFDAQGNTCRIPLSVGQRRALAESGTVRVQSPEAVKNFLFSFIVRRGLSPEERREHREQLSSNHNKRKIGRDLVLYASKTAMSSIEDKFSEAWDAGLLPLAQTRDVGEFICDLLVARPRGDVSVKAIRRFEHALSAA